jgi:hypothetical protein
MADYKAGDLNLSIQTISNDTIKSLDAVIERLNLIEKGLGGIKGSGYLKKTSTKTQKSNNKNIGMFGFAKLGISLHLMRRMGRFMANLVQAGSDYNETLNLWQVAMRNNLDVAEQFVNKMQKAYGISTKTLMNAQAIFKNMIGSLGQISDQTAYALSEALVQMSADFASLYNVSIESAFEKMQSMLAGQVRPIRFAGLDITETTLFQFYQQIGGTKTMRQLNRTEKQLLSILAVYQQMGSAGALGDMTKTLNLFANQSRMMTEYWADLKTWSGLLLKDLVDQSGMLIKINALLITATEIIKAIAKSRGIGDENFIDEIFEVTKVTNDEIDKLQGKLLDFDKFRSLEGAGASPLAIDEKILEVIAGYSSKIDQAENAAQLLAEDWLKVLGFTKDANGEWEISETKLNTLKNVFEAIGISVGIIVGYKLASWFYGIATAGTVTSTSLGIFNALLLGGTIFAILQAVDAFKQGNHWGGILATAIGVLLFGAFLKIKIGAMGGNVELLKFYSTAGLLIVGVASLIGGIKVFVDNFDKLSTRAKVWIPILATLAGAITAVAAGLTFMKGNWIGAIGLGALVTGIGLSVGTKLSVPNYEMGASDIDSGTIFRAGEFGKTEAVYTGSNGKTNVANIQQMKAAELQALKEWWATAKHDIPAFQGVSDSGIYTMVEGEARRRGKQFSKVR